MAKRVKLSNDHKWANADLKDRLRNDPYGVLRERGLNAPDEMPSAIVHEFIRVAYLVWVEGAVLPVDQFTLDPADEGLLFGRGVWESTRTIGGEPWLWNEHLQRLKLSAQLLGIDVDETQLPQSDTVSEYVRGLTSQDVIVRLNLTAGRPGGRGRLWMSAAPLPSTPPSIRLQTVRNPVQKGQAYLTLKTFQYATRLRLHQQANLAGFDTALLYDEKKNVQEAAHANIFLRLHTGWVTPAADGGLLPGTVRHVLVQAAPIPIREGVVKLAELPNVREAFLTSSSVGIVPITAIDGAPISLGAQTQKLKRWLEPPLPDGPRYHFVNKQIVNR